MAQTLEQIRNSGLTSIFGRRLGITPDEYLGGFKDNKKVVTDLTSASSATAMPAHGYINIVGTSLLTSGNPFLLPLPVPGVEVTFFNINAATSAGSPGSTAFTMIRPSTAFVITSSEGSTGTTINLAAGYSITLAGLSTALYAVKSRGTLAGTIVNGTT